MSDLHDAADDLVIGAAYGYDEAKIAPFLRSLRNTGYSGAIALLVRKDQFDSLANSPLFKGVDLVVAPSWRPSVTDIYHKRAASLFWFPYGILTWLALATLRPFGRLRRKVAARTLHAYWSRHFEYLEYLVARDFRNVMLSDTRDVLFQTNPSDLMAGATGLSVSVETTAYTIGEEYWNSRWVKTAYGSKGLAAVADRPVTCAGVTFADAHTMREYLQKMTRAVLGFNPWALEHAPDQPVHNYMVWTGQFGHINPMHSLESPVATLNATDAEGLAVDDGLLHNTDGSVVGIVHQYDRPPGLAVRLQAYTSAVSEPKG